MDGGQTIRAFGISDGIPYSMDTEISISRPEYWSEGVFGKTFSEGNERITGMRDSEVQHTAGSYTHGNDNTAEIFSEWSSREDKRDD